MTLLLLMILTLVPSCWSYPICPNRTRTALQPNFTKPLGDFDYVVYGKAIALQCCSEGVRDIRWFRLENGQWQSFPYVEPGISDAPRLEEEKQILRIFVAKFSDNTDFKCVLDPIHSEDSGQNKVLEHKTKLNVVACDELPRGPIITEPFPKDQYIDSFGGNVTLQCSGYFGCSDDGTIEGDSFWLVKENGHFSSAKNITSRYSVKEFKNMGNTIEIATLMISPILPEDLNREFICTVTSPQILNETTQKHVRIYKKEGPINIAMWIGIAVGAVLAFVLVITILGAVVRRFWGPQIKWYFRSRYSFGGPKPVDDEKLEYNAFLYHDDQDTAVANEIRDKLAEQGFNIFLSSDIKGGRLVMGTIEKVSSSSAIVIFLYTENLWSDFFSQLLFECVVVSRNGKGILFLEVEKFKPEKALEETKKVKQTKANRQQGAACTDLSISVEEDCCHPNERGQTNQETTNQSVEKMDINFWKALPRLKVPSDKSSDREKNNFHCAIQNKIPYLRNQKSSQKSSSSSSMKRSSKDRCSSSGKPLLSEDHSHSPGPASSPFSDEVFGNSTTPTKFSYENEALSRNASVQDPQQATVPDNSAGQKPFLPSENEAGASSPLLPHSENEAEVQMTVRVCADIHQENSGQTPPPEEGVFSLSGEVRSQNENGVNMNLEQSAMENMSAVEKDQNSLQIHSANSGQQSPDTAVPNSYKSDCESGYVTSPNSGSDGSSPDYGMGEPFKKRNALDTGEGDSIEV